MSLADLLAFSLPVALAPSKTANQWLPGSAPVTWQSLKQIWAEWKATLPKLAYIFLSFNG